MSPKKSALRARAAQAGLFEEPAPRPAPPSRPEPPPPASPKKAAAPREDAQSMAARQREISISEFFTKNRHLLGFDNPQKALLTAIKEAVAVTSGGRQTVSVNTATGEIEE